MLFAHRLPPFFSLVSVSRRAWLTTSSTRTVPAGAGHQFGACQQLFRSYASSRLRAYVKRLCAYPLNSAIPVPDLSAAALTCSEQSIIDAQGQHFCFLGPIAQSEFSNISERGLNEWRYRIDGARDMTPVPDLAPVGELSRVVPEAGFHAPLMYERRGSCTLTSA
jgi:hypothetical protein